MCRRLPHRSLRTLESPADLAIAWSLKPSPPLYPARSTQTDRFLVRSPCRLTHGRGSSSTEDSGSGWCDQQKPFVDF